MRKIIALLFVLFLSASAFGGQYFPPVNFQFDIDGAMTTVATQIAVGQTGSIYRSMDYGANWTSLYNAGTVGNTTLNGISIAGGTIYIGGGLGGAGKVFKSTDWGSSWTAVNPAAIEEVFDLYFQDASVGVATVQTAGPQYRVRFTTNGGTSWSAPNSFPDAGDLWTSVSGAGSNVFWVVGNGGSIRKTTSGGNDWVSQTSGTASGLNAVFALDANNVFIVGEGSTFLYTTDGGTNWIAPTVGGDGLSLRGFGVHAVDANTVWITGWADGAPNVSKLYKLTKSGSSWTSSLVFSYSGGRFYNLYLTDNSNVWPVGSGQGESSGQIYGQIAAATVTSTVQQGTTQSRAPQGATVNLTLTGPNFQVGSWTPGMVVFSGSGITVNSVTRNSGTQLTANVSIGSAATAGNRDVTITNIDGSSTPTVNAFLISLPPSITSVNPSQVYQNWIGTITATGSAFQVDPGSTVVFTPMTAGTTLELVGTPAIVSATTAVATVSATDVGQFRVWLMNADGGRGLYDFFVVNSFSPPVPQWIGFNGVTYDATTYPYPPGQLISPIPRVTAVFTDTEQGFNTSSQNTAKLILISDGTLTSIYNVTPESVRLEAGNTRAVIDYQVPSGLAFPSSVNTVQAYMENSSGEAGRVTARVRIGYALMTGVSDKTALVFPHVWDLTRDLELQFKVPASYAVPPFIEVLMVGSDGRIMGKPSRPTRVVFTDATSQIVKLSVRANDPFLHLSNGMLLMRIGDLAKAKVVVQQRP